MSVALAMAVIDYDNFLFVTTAKRKNLIRVERAEATERDRTAEISVDRKIDQFLPLLLRQYNYSGAIAELKNLLQSSELPVKSSRRIRLLKDCCLSLRRLASLRSRSSLGFTSILYEKARNSTAWDVPQKGNRQPC